MPENEKPRKTVSIPKEVMELLMQLAPEPRMQANEEYQTLAHAMGRRSLVLDLLAHRDPGLPTSVPTVVPVDELPPQSDWLDKLIEDGFGQ